jgi:hypothetical protein
MRRWIMAWLERHQHPASQALHAFAIPLLPGALVLTILQLVDGSWDSWWRPAGLVSLSYGMQWLGHRIEGNDMGEWIVIKRWLGRPYVVVSPRYLSSTGRCSSASVAPLESRVQSVGPSE